MRTENLRRGWRTTHPTVSLFSANFLTIQQFLPKPSAQARTSAHSSLGLGLSQLDFAYE